MLNCVKKIRTNIFKNKNYEYYTEVNMEKNSVKMGLFCILVITSILVIIPIYGINTVEKDNIIREIQWCCSDEEDRNDDIHNLLRINILQLKHY
jgi:hypothetical protein